MNDNLIYLKVFSAPCVDRREALRYAGARESTAELEALLDECIAEAEGVLIYKVCYRVFDINVGADSVNLGFAETGSTSLIKTLSGCNGAIVFCATVGAGIDRLIAKYNLVSPAKAVMMQALGSERVEALCDAFCESLKDDTLGYIHTGRFSPGYGDLPLDLQRDIFLSLDCTRRIGVSLNDDLFMTPTKSVTAIIGIKM